MFLSIEGKPCCVGFGHSHDISEELHGRGANVRKKCMILEAVVYGSILDVHRVSIWDATLTHLLSFTICVYVYVNICLCVCIFVCLVYIFVRLNVRR